LSKKNSKEKSRCNACYGFGWWPYGSLCPLGPIDGGEMSSIVIKCPWCGAGKKKDERYKKLVVAKKKYGKEPFKDERR